MFQVSCIEYLVSNMLPLRFCIPPLPQGTYYWPKKAVWNGTGSGWFKGPRTLPLILAFLSDKKLTGGRDVSRVYLELMARHMDGGIVEIGNEGDHAFGSGYTGTRAIRTWCERMQLLERLGFIRSKQVGNQRYRLVQGRERICWLTQCLRFAVLSAIQFAHWRPEHESPAWAGLLESTEFISPRHA
jgi:hypothetical protein